MLLALPTYEEALREAIEAGDAIEHERTEAEKDADHPADS